MVALSVVHHHFALVVKGRAFEAELGKSLLKESHTLNVRIPDLEWDGDTFENAESPTLSPLVGLAHLSRAVCVRGLLR